MTNNIHSFKLIKPDERLFEPPSEHSVSIATVLRKADELGMTREQLINQYMGVPQDPHVLAIVASSFELAHAYLLVGSHIQILDREDCDA
jgi:hypothetical protein